MAHQHLLGIITGIALVIVLTATLSAYLLEMFFGFGVFLVAGFLIVIYVLFPVIFHYSPLLQRHMIFMNLCHWSFGRKYFEPSRHRISGGRNFYLSPEPGVKLGVWHILPKSKASDAVTGKDVSWEATIKESGHPVMIYFHGNMGSRASGHRLDLYRLLQDLDFHVIAFDYRRFGKSTSMVAPSESGLVTDSLCIYEWVRDILGENSQVPIFFWGHSLGTGVSVHLASDLCSQKVLPPPTGIILEAPFTSMADAVMTSISSIVFRPLPSSWRKWLLASPLNGSDLAFESERHIQNIHIPVLILHATTDLVVPYKLGKRLYDVALKTRPKDSGPVMFKSFKGVSRSSAHVFICKEPDLLDTLKEFTCSCYSFQDCDADET